MGIKQYIRASHRFRDMIKAHGKDMLDIHTLGRMLSEAGITIPQEVRSLILIKTEQQFHTIQLK